jgi:hypothetical protein
MAAAFWDDLFNPWLENGGLYYYHDEVKHRFIVEWYEVGHNDEWDFDPETFQAILLDPDHYTTTTGDGEIVFQYSDIANKSSMTVGIENHAQDVGLQYVYNNDYDPTASSVRNGTAIKFTTEAPFTSVSVEENIAGLNLLKQNYPNPFSSQTMIAYAVQESGNVTLNIYNLNGELVKTLVNNTQSTGNYSVTWNGLNNQGKHVDSGIYIYRLQTNSTIETKKLYVLK